MSEETKKELIELVMRLNKAECEDVLQYLKELLEEYEPT